MTVQYLRIPFERITSNDTPVTVNRFNFKDIKEVPDALEGFAGAPPKLIGCGVNLYNSIQTNKGIIPIGITDSTIDTFTNPMQAAGISFASSNYPVSFRPIVQASGIIRTAWAQIVGTMLRWGYVRDSTTNSSAFILPTTEYSVCSIIQEDGLSAPSVVVYNRNTFLVKLIRPTPASFDLCTCTSAPTGTLLLGSRLVISDSDTIYWSADGNVTDFVPSIITGAGSGQPTGAVGAINAIETCHLGFYILCSGNAIIGYNQAGDPAYPYKFQPIAKSVGGRYITRSPDHSRTFISGDAGLYELTPTDCKVFNFNVWDACVTSQAPENAVARNLYQPTALPVIQMFFGRYLLVQDKNFAFCWVIDVIDGYVTYISGSITPEYVEPGTNTYLFCDSSPNNNGVTSGVESGFNTLLVNSGAAGSVIRYVISDYSQVSYVYGVDSIELGRFKIDGYHGFRVTNLNLACAFRSNGDPMPDITVRLQCMQRSDVDYTELYHQDFTLLAANNYQGQVLFECAGDLRIMIGVPMGKFWYCFTGLEFGIVPNTSRFA